MLVVGIEVYYGKEAAYMIRVSQLALDDKHWDLQEEVYMLKLDFSERAQQSVHFVQTPY